MNAGLTISDSIYARIDGANFGLILSETELGFATSGGSFDLSLAPLGSVSATSAEIATPMRSRPMLAPWLVPAM